MKKLSKPIAVFCIFMLSISLLSGVQVSSADTPKLTATPKSFTIEYLKVEYACSGLKLNIPTDENIYKYYDDGTDFYPYIQVDWKFSKDDDWKYCSEWDSLRKSNDNNEWEYIDLTLSNPQDSDFTSVQIFDFDTTDLSWAQNSWSKIIPKSYFKTVDMRENSLYMVDWNKVEIQVRYRYVVACQIYNESTYEYEYVSSCSPWSDTVSYGNFSKDYENIDNLLVNPDFENGLKGWKDPDKVWEPLFTSDVGDAKHGNFLTWPERSGSLEKNTTRIYQDISLENYNVDDTVILNAMICNYDQAPHDMGKVTLTFIDEKGVTINTYSQTQRNPNWNSQTLICSIPEGAKKLRVSLWAYRYVGSDIDAYYDYCSLVIKPIKVSPVTITEPKNKSTAIEGETLQLTANNSKSTDPSDYVWTSSYNTAATVDANGLVTMHTDAEDGLAIYAKDKESGVTGVYWINTPDEKNASAISDSSVISEIQKPETPAISKLSAATGIITVSWKKNPGITGYEIRYSTKSNMANAKTVKITKSSTVKKKISKLTSNKKYYVQIRTYIKDGKKTIYSNWSKKKSVTVK